MSKYRDPVIKPTGITDPAHYRQRRRFLRIAAPGPLAAPGLGRAGSRARCVEFTTLHRPGEVPGQHDGVPEWPCVEGSRRDEAVHPLTILAAGLYGEVNQNGCRCGWWCRGNTVSSASSRLCASACLTRSRSIPGSRVGAR